MVLQPVVYFMYLSFQEMCHIFYFMLMHSFWLSKQCQVTSPGLEAYRVTNLKSSHFDFPN